MTIKQGTQDWLDLRKKYVTASDARVIMGVDPWTTPYQRWAEKVGLAKAPESQPHQTRGLEMESTIMGEYERLTGETMFQEVVFSKDNGFAMASLDGLNLERTRFVELKMPNKEDHEMALKGKVPEKYWVQMQWQIECTGLNSGDYFSYREWYEEGEKKVSTVLIKVARDQDYINKMLEKGAEFYRAIKNMEPPALTQKDIINKESDELYAIAAANWKRDSAALRIAEEQEAKSRQALVCMTGGYNTVGCGLKITRVMRKGSIDYKAIPELQGLDLEYYKRPATESWRITETGE